MPNAMLGEADAATGGETLHLVLDNAAFLAVEAVTDDSFLNAVAHLLACAETGRLPKVGVMQALLYGATRARHPEMTVVDCGDLFMRHSGPLTDAINAALIGALPKAEEKDTGEATASGGTGTAPSARGSKRAPRPKSSGEQRPGS